MLPTGLVLVGTGLVAVASQQPVDTAAITDVLADRGLDWRVAGGAELDAFVGDAPVLTDDVAPSTSC